MEGPTLEDTILEDDNAVQVDRTQRHYDPLAENTLPGTTFPSISPGVDGVRRRHQARLAVTRTPFMEPIGDKREPFYEMRLILGLAWFCSEAPEKREDGKVVWHFHWEPPPEVLLGESQLEPQELELGASDISFEHRCAVLERRFGQREYDLICPCCIQETPNLICDACKFAVGFHKCSHSDRMRWRRGTLFAGELDVQRVLFNLHRRGLPMPTLHDKADEYVDAGLLRPDDATSMVRAIEQERGVARTINEVGGADDANAPGTRNSSHLSSQQLTLLLAEREAKLQTSEFKGVTDQWRVYTEIINAISNGERLRMLVQASAGTGKSYMMTTVMLWCVINGKKARAAAPTGIAASNIEIEGTSVSATTLHAMFDFDTELTTKLDFAKGESNKKVKELLELDVLFLDEISMIDAGTCVDLEHCSDFMNTGFVSLTRLMPTKQYISCVSVCLSRYNYVQRSNVPHYPDVLDVLRVTGRRVASHGINAEPCRPHSQARCTGRWGPFWKHCPGSLWGFQAAPPCNQYATIHHRKRIMWDLFFQGVAPESARGGR